VFLEDDDLGVYDARGKGDDCALKFVQATAEPEAESTVLEIPFRVKVDRKLVRLRVGDAYLSLAQDRAAE
jgi:hypothetical protein